MLEFVGIETSSIVRSIYYAYISQKVDLSGLRHINISLVLSFKKQYIYVMCLSLPSIHVYSLQKIYITSEGSVHYIILQKMSDKIRKCLTNTFIFRFYFMYFHSTRCIIDSLHKILLTMLSKVLNRSMLLVRKSILHIKYFLYLLLI